MRMMTTEQAAQELGVGAPTIRKAIRQKRITAQKLGRDWIVIDDEKFQNFKPGKAGRPKREE